MVLDWNHRRHAYEMDVRRCIRSRDGRFDQELHRVRTLGGISEVAEGECVDEGVESDGDSGHDRPFLAEVGGEPPRPVVRAEGQPSVPSGRRTCADRGRPKLS